MPTRVDVIRAAFMSIVTSAISVAVLAGLNISPELQAAITLLVNNITLMFMLLVPSGGTPSVSQGAPKMGETKP